MTVLATVAILTLAQALPAPTLARVSDLITAALHPATTTTEGQRP